MDFWTKARSFAEQAAKRTQDLTKEAAKRSQDLSIGGSKFSDIIAETTKRSKEFAAEASKRADQIRIEAIKRADQIKHLAEGANSPKAEPPVSSGSQDDDLERFGITDELREFVKGITLTTFRDFPLDDDTQLSDVPTVSNVRQDLTEWQAKHANLVLSTVQEISQFRYELCPRVMKERKFWRIYFILVNSHIAPYEKRCMEEAKLYPMEQVKDEKTMEPPKVDLTVNQKVQEDKETMEPPKVDSTISQKVQVDDKAMELQQVGSTTNGEVQQVKKENKTPASTEQDLDEFLLGDSDDDPGVDDGGFDDDFDNMVDSSDDEKGKS